MQQFSPLSRASSHPVQVGSLPAELHRSAPPGSGTFGNLLTGPPPGLPGIVNPLATAAGPIPGATTRFTAPPSREFKPFHTMQLPLPISKDSLFVVMVSG